MNRIILNETSYFGAGCRSVIAVEAARRGFKKAFFVTDKDLIKFGVAAEIIKVFDENQIVAAAVRSTVPYHERLWENSIRQRHSLPVLWLGYQ